MMLFFFSSRRRHTRLVSDWSSDVCSSDLEARTMISSIPYVLASLRLMLPLASPHSQNLPPGAAVGHAEAGAAALVGYLRSEERRVGKECRWRWWTHRLRRERC